MAPLRASLGDAEPTPLVVASLDQSEPSDRQAAIRQCRQMMADLRTAEQKARRLAFAAAHVMTAARSIGTRACQIAERARDAEQSLLDNLRATSSAWVAIHRSAGSMSLRDGKADNLLAYTQEVAAALHRATEAADRAHGAALHATALASGFSLQSTAITRQVALIGRATTRV